MFNSKLYDELTAQVEQSKQDDKKESISDLLLNRDNVCSICGIQSLETDDPENLNKSSDTSDKLDIEIHKKFIQVSGRSDNQGDKIFETGVDAEIERER